MNIKIRLFFGNNVINTFNYRREGKKSHSDCSVGAHFQCKRLIFVEKMLDVSGQKKQKLGNQQEHKKNHSPPSEGKQKRQSSKN